MPSNNVDKKSSEDKNKSRPSSFPPSSSSSSWFDWLSEFQDDQRLERLQQVSVFYFFSLFGRDYHSFFLFLLMMDFFKTLLIQSLLSFYIRSLHTPLLYYILHYSNKIVAYIYIALSKVGSIIGRLSEEWEVIIREIRRKGSCLAEY